MGINSFERQFQPGAFPWKVGSGAAAFSFGSTTEGALGLGSVAGACSQLVTVVAEPQSVEAFSGQAVVEVGAGQR